SRIARYGHTAKSTVKLPPPLTAGRVHPRMLRIQSGEGDMLKAKGLALSAALGGIVISGFPAPSSAMIPPFGAANRDDVIRVQGSSQERPQRRKDRSKKSDKAKTEPPARFGSSDPDRQGTMSRTPAATKPDPNRVKAPKP